MKFNVKRVTVEMLILAAAAVTPQLVELGTQALQAKNVERLSVEERSILKKPECKAVCTGISLNSDQV